MASGWQETAIICISSIFTPWESLFGRHRWPCKIKPFKFELPFISALIHLSIPNSLPSPSPPLSLSLSLSFDHPSLLLQKTKTRAKSVGNHKLLQMVTLVAVLIGFAAMYQSKVERGKPHFATWHGLIGVIASCLVVGAGFFKAGSGSLVKIPPLSSKPLFDIIKKTHSTFGYAAILLFLVTPLLKINSDAFEAYSLILTIGLIFARAL